MEEEVFQLDAYLKSSKKLDFSQIAWHEIRNYPLYEEELRCMQYMMDIESHTIIYLRDLLLTRTASEPDMTAFLSCWAYEEMWHGEAFSRFLGEAGYTLAPDKERTMANDPFPSKVGRNRMIRHSKGGMGLTSLIATVIGSIIFPHFPALHMTWGAVNELSTLNGYKRLLAKTRHPILRDLLGKIMADESRHYAFYRMQAISWLKKSTYAKKLTRFAMENVWAPVGTGTRPQEETDFVLSYLFGDEDGMQLAKKMDEKIQLLPGFEKCTIITRSLIEADKRAGEAHRKKTDFAMIGSAFAKASADMSPRLAQVG